MVRFRDGGRVFQAHVYGPPRCRREALAILDSLLVRPAPFDERIDAASFPAAAGWRTRVSEPSHERSCSRQRISWASTVPFGDPPRELPPHDMIAGLPPDGIVKAAVQYTDCRRALRGIEALRLPLRLERATRSGFPGPRGEELPLYRSVASRGATTSTCGSSTVAASRPRRNAREPSESSRACAGRRGCEARDRASAPHIATASSFTDRERVARDRHVATGDAVPPRTSGADETSDVNPGIHARQSRDE